MTTLLTFLAFQLVLDLKLCGVPDEVLSVLVVTVVPAAGLIGMWLDTKVYISIEPKRKRRRQVEVPIYTFVEEKTEFKQSWPMIEVETGKEIRIE